MAVLALYRAERDAFSADDLQVLEALGVGVGGVIEALAAPKASAATAGKR